MQHAKRSEAGSSVGPIDIKIQDKITALAWQSLNEKSQSLRQSAVHQSQLEQQPKVLTGEIEMTKRRQEQSLEIFIQDKGAVLKD